MRFRAFPCTLLLVLSLSPLAARADSFTGTWSIEQSSKPGDVHLRVVYRRADANGNEEWDESNDVPLTSLRGLSANDVQSDGARKSFTIVRDAGEFRADGTFNGGQGGGTWTFFPNAHFRDEFRGRGLDAPTDKQQFQLGMGDFHVSTLDTLLRSGFERPSAADLVRLVEHGVSGDYLNAMRGLRFQPKTIDELIRLRDHGVDPPYAAAMLQRAPRLTAEDLIELRDHGVGAEYMQALSAGGYGSVSPGDAERMMDHGVSREYLAGLRRLGYHPSVDDLVRLADHGVSVSFIERMRSHGYTHLSVEDLIRLRDHGF